MAKNEQQSVHIIGGMLRRRKIDFVTVNDLRPTGSRLRETLFNWLQPYLHEAHCVDLFAGSGILGIEAISRGAHSVTFVEKNRVAAKQLSQNVSTLGIDNATIINDDYHNALKRIPSADIIFLDPPYQLRILPKVMQDIEYLSPRFIFLEDDQEFSQWILAFHDYELVKSKKAGSVYYGLLEKR